MQLTRQNNQDIIIIGGGIVGLITAYILAKNNFTVTLIERNKLKFKQTDGRAISIAAGTKELLVSLQLWDQFEEYAGAINHIRVSDNNSNLFLHFDYELIQNKTLGYMLENYLLFNGILDKVNKHPNINILDNSSYLNIEFTQNSVEVTLGNNQIIAASLLIAADGKNSSVRELLNIKSYQFDYHQTAIVCNVTHELNHLETAQERFLPAGPFAILPLKGGYRSSIVWTEKSSVVPCLMQMSNLEFNSYLAERFTDYLGKVQLNSDRFTYPLSLSFSLNYFKKRAVLIGDAAHAIHPIAGQGLNLNLKDVESLTDLIIKYKSLGLDIGSQIMLAEYQTLRKPSNLVMIAMTDGLNRLFSNNLPILTSLRRIGIATVNKIPKLKKFFMKHAMAEG